MIRSLDNIFIIQYIGFICPRITAKWQKLTGTKTCLLKRCFLCRNDRRLICFQKVVLCLSKMMNGREGKGREVKELDGISEKGRPKISRGRAEREENGVKTDEIERVGEWERRNNGRRRGRRKMTPLLMTVQLCAVYCGRKLGPCTHDNILVMLSRPCEYQKATFADN